jgi:hypothetical protein
MPAIRLKTHTAGVSLPVAGTAGVPLIPLFQFRVLVRLPTPVATYDGIVDTGSPLTWLPEAIWSQLDPGSDYEWLPFPGSYHPPTARTAGWDFTFRLARLLTPLTLLDSATTHDRTGAIVQFAEGDPPAYLTSNRPPRLVIGLWGGVLEGSSLRIDPDPATGSVAGWLDF